jgi:23S rRNA (adenine2503-C2)-methyltransferase
MNNKIYIYDLDFTDLDRIVRSWGEPSYRTNQIWEGLYKHLWTDPEEYSNLPHNLRRSLKDTLYFKRLSVYRDLFSRDRETQKILFELYDDKAIETVLMRYSRRRTLCISTQAGCAMGCVFCATGQMGFVRHLTSGEIVEQVLHFAKKLKNENDHLTNIVVMGMGEPFHNYDATFAAIERLNHPTGFNFGARRFTVSTVGIIPAIKRFTRENRQVNLAISLHSCNDELRSSLLPINRKYPVDELLNTCREYVQSTRRRITFEWALIQDVNDSLEEASSLGAKLQNFRLDGSILCHVNVIPLNPTRDFHGKGTTREKAIAFHNELEKLGIPTTVRIRRGIDIQAGCGQLAISSGGLTL